MEIERYPKVNPVFQKPVFKKYQAAVNYAILAMEPYFVDTQKIDTLSVRRARKENLLVNNKEGELVCERTNDEEARCGKAISTILQRYERELRLTPKEGIAFLIMGLPGSGKTTSLRYLDAERIVEKNVLDKAFKPNADEIKTLLPGYSTTKGTSEFVHNESVNYFKTEINKAIDQRANVVIELSGSYFDYINKYIDGLKLNKYKEINIVYVDVNLQTSMERVAKRYEQTGRFLDPKVIYSVGTVVDRMTADRNYSMHPAENYKYLLKSKLVDIREKTEFNFYWVDNNGDKPRLINAKSKVKML